MAIGVIGRKCGMTRVFTEQGESIPVTVIDVKPNIIVQVKTKEKEGYDAIQVTTGERPASHVNKAEAGHYKKANAQAGRGLWEFRLEGKEAFEAGQELELATLFKEGQNVDIQAKSKGKGFAGVIKRHNFSSQRMTHGNSRAHRKPGSIGQNQTPGKVFKGKKMSGQLGNVNKTIQNQIIVKIDPDKKLILLKGTVPGAPGGYVIVKPSVKKKAGGTK